MATAQVRSVVFDKKHQNFFRLTTLILDVGAEVLREVFASYYPSKSLTDYLAEQNVWTVIDSLVNSRARVLTEEQEDLLYPPNGQDPDLNTFDITLLYTLIRNLNVNILANNKVWNQPGSRTTIEADVTRIRDARNRLHGHVNSAAICDTEYVNEKTALVTIYQRIIQKFQSPSLTLKNLQDKVDAVENEPMDQVAMNSLVERLELSVKVEEISQKVDNIRETLEQVEMRIDAMETTRSTGVISGGSIQGVGTDMTRTEDSPESKLVSTANRQKMDQRIDQTRVLLESHRHDTSPLYVHTSSYNKAKTMLHRERCLLISGIPGAGKTSMALELLQELTTENPEIKPIRITSAKEWNTLVHPHEQLCVYIDDFLGKYKIEDKDLSEWSTLADLVLANIKKGNTSLLLTMRKSLLSGLQGLSKKSEKIKSTSPIDMILATENTIDLSDQENQVTGEEKRLILDTYIKIYGIRLDEETIDQICNSKEIIGFPQSCKMLNTVISALSSKNMFTNPYNFLTMEVEKMHSHNPDHFATLLLVLLNDGALTYDFGTEVTKQEVSRLIDKGTSWINKISLYLKALSGTYLNFIADSKIYGFIHDVVEEVMFHQFVNIFPTKAIELCPIRLISKFCKGQESSQERDDPWGTITLNESQFRSISRRFDSVMESKQSHLFQQIVEARVWNSYSFRSSCLQYLRENGTLIAFCTAEDGNKLTLIAHAARAGNISLVIKILQTFCTSNAVQRSEIDRQLNEGLAAACHSWNTEIFPLIIEQAFNIAEEVVLNVAENGRVSDMKLLVHKCGDDILKYAKQKDLGKTTLHFACLKGHYDMSKYLLDTCPALLHINDDEERSPLYLAACGENLELYKYIEAMVEDKTFRTARGQTPLHTACISGRIDIVKYILIMNPNQLNDVNIDGNNPLTLAAWGGDVSTLQYLLNVGANPRSKRTNGMNILHESCMNGQETMARYLCSRFPFLVDERDSLGYTALHFAAISGSIQMIEYLLGHGLDPMCKTNKERTLLHLACENDKGELSRYLVHKYPHLVRHVGTDNFTTLHAAACSSNLTLFEFIWENITCTSISTQIEPTGISQACYKGSFHPKSPLENPDINVKVSLDTRDTNGYTVLHYAARSGSIQIIEYLLAHGLDPMCKTNNGQTLLHLACSSDREDLARYLVHKYPDMVYVSGDGNYTILHAAAEGSRLSLFDFILQQGVSATTKYRQSSEVNCGHTSFVRACCFGKKEVVEYIADHFPELIEDGDDRGYTPLHHAVGRGKLGIVKCLLQYGADPMCRSNSGNTILFQACLKGKLEVARYITHSFSSLIKETDNNDNTVLVAAVYSGNTEVFEFLLQFDISPYRTCKNDLHILYIACQYGKLEIVKYICKHFPTLIRKPVQKRYYAIDKAVSCGHTTIVDYLVTQEGVSLDRSLQVTNAGVKNILEDSCSKGLDNLVRHIIGNFPELLSSPATERDLLPIQKATEGGHLQLVEFLLLQIEDKTSRAKCALAILEYALAMKKENVKDFLLQSDLVPDE